MVPEVEELHAKLKLQVLSDGRILEYRDIGIPNRRAGKGISLFVAEANHSPRRVRGQGGYAGRSRERGRVHVAAGGYVGKRIADYGRAAQVAVAKYREWEAGSGTLDDIDLPTRNKSVHGSAVTQVLLSLSTPPI